MASGSLQGKLLAVNLWLRETGWFVASAKMVWTILGQKIPFAKMR